MDRRKFIKSSLLGTGVFFLSNIKLFSANKLGKRKPNIICIYVDDLGYADLGCQGSKEIRTPNIDRLAGEGIRCTAGYVCAPVCGPSRAGFITGRFHERYGVFGNSQADEGLPLSEKTIADYMKQAGYKTCAIGKWHLGLGEPYHPNKRGFDKFVGFLEGGSSYFPFREPKDEKAQIIYDNRTPVKQPQDTYLTDFWTKAAIEYIDKNVDNPFFMYLAYNAPHQPLEAKEDDLKANAHIADAKRRTFAAMMTALDRGVGQVIDFLQKKEIRNDTLIFFISDNGGPTDKNTSRNDPFRGVKGDVLEGGCRVPFIISWPGAIASGKAEDTPVYSLDICPTVAALADVALPKDKEFDGVNLMPFLKGKEKSLPERSIYLKRHSAVAVRKGKHKFIKKNPGEPDAPGLYDIEENYKENPSNKLSDGNDSQLSTDLDSFLEKLQKPEAKNKIKANLKKSKNKRKLK